MICYHIPQAISTVINNIGSWINLKYIKVAESITFSILQLYFECLLAILNWKKRVFWTCSITFDQGERQPKTITAYGTKLKIKSGEKITIILA